MNTKARCPVCDTELPADRHWRTVFCSPGCRQKAFYAKHSIGPVELRHKLGYE